MAGKDWTVVVEPGYLLGPQGDEILIDACVEVDLSVQGLDGNAASPCVDPVDPWCASVRVDRRVGQRLFIAAAYAECPSRPVRVQPAGCGCDDAGCEYSRLRDGYVLRVLTSLPDSYAQMKPPVKPWLCPPGGVRSCPDCVADPWVILAAITVRGSTVGDNDIDNVSYRRHVIGFADDYVLCGPKLLSIVLVPTAVVGGKASTATVTIDRPAPQGDSYIMLASSDPTSAIVADSVIVPAGKTSAPTTVNTTPAGPGGAVLISATLLGDTKSATLQILAVKSVTLDQEYVQVGTSTGGTVELTAPAPAGGIAVTLTVDDATLATIPGSVTVPEAQTTAHFSPITTTGAGGLVTVSAAATPGGAAKTAKLGTYSLSTLGVGSARSVAGRTEQGTVTLTGVVPPAGVPVALTSMNVSVINNLPLPLNVADPTSPVTVFGVANPVPPYGASAPFAIAVNRGGVAELTATLGAQQTNARVDAIGIASIQLGPVNDKGEVIVELGSTVTGIVTLSEKVPPGPDAVADLLADSSFLRDLPANVSIPPGSISAKFKCLAVKVTPKPKLPEESDATLPVTARVGERGLDHLHGDLPAAPVTCRPGCRDVDFVAGAAPAGPPGNRGPGQSRGRTSRTWNGSAGSSRARR